jgi:hypothetical protein
VPLVSRLDLWKPTTFLYLDDTLAVGISYDILFDLANLPFVSLRWLSCWLFRDFSCQSFSLFSRKLTGDTLRRSGLRRILALSRVTHGDNGLE